MAGAGTGTARNSATFLFACTLLVLAIGSCSGEWLPQPSQFWSVFQNNWGEIGKSVIYENNGYDMQLALTPEAGASLASYPLYLFGYFSVSLKLIAGNSAGTVTTFYLISDEPDMEHPTRDELDLEFLGNATGEPYTLHTNIYVNGKGDREHTFKLWFDPTQDYHNYSILWNVNHIVFSVDGIPIRVYKNYQSSGAAFPTTRPMKLQASLWNGDAWATQNGRVKLDWSAAPFVTSYKNLVVSGCTTLDFNDCAYNSQYVWNQGEFQALSYAQQGQMQWARSVSLLYDACNDLPRFNYTPNPECFLPQY